MCVCSLLKNKIYFYNTCMTMVMMMMMMTAMIVINVLRRCFLYQISGHLLEFTNLLEHFAFLHDYHFGE